MNSTTHGLSSARSLIAAAVAAVLIAACAAAPVAPQGAAEARAKLIQLQSDPKLATLAPVAMDEADTAVRIAEQPVADEAVGSHRVYLADRKVEIARAQAETRWLENQRAALGTQRQEARLESRTLEADTARVATAEAKAETAEAEAVTVATSTRTNSNLKGTPGTVRGFLHSGRACSSVNVKRIEGDGMD